jgi:hypothetical protein
MLHGFTLGRKIPKKAMVKKPSCGRQNGRPKDA